MSGYSSPTLCCRCCPFVAQNERETILLRQREGIRAAKARGVRFGRPRRVLPDDFPEVAAMWKGKDITIHEALELTEMPRSSFYAAAKRHLEQLTEAAG